jgi:putative tryptophan/tyrosine transport system substrate-binding protein
MRAFDPQETLDVHCGNGFDAGFSPYQSARLSRYNAPLTLGADMRRREFISLFGGTAIAWPLVARAQQPAMPVVGFLGAASAELFASQVRAFRQGLSETGHIEGRNVAIEYRWAEGQYDRLPELATDLVCRRVSVLVTSGGDPPAQAAQAATTTIPIVFNMSADPIQLGLVASLGRPGGNVTGVTSLNVEVAPKRLELLCEVMPTATTIALLVHPNNRSTAERTALQAAARSRGLQLPILQAGSDDDLDAAFASLIRLRASGLVIGQDAFFIARPKQIAALALHHSVPTVYQFRDFAAAGGLMSYGGEFTDTYHQSGVYAGRILKGEKPGDLPVQQVTNVRLIVNLKTAKSLGLTIPLPLLGRADEVIE